MTNRIAIGLALTVVALIALNFAMGWSAHIFLGRKFVALVEWLAIWR